VKLRRVRTPRMITLPMMLIIPPAISATVGRSPTT
jgi:hypothetical protein